MATIEEVIAQIRKLRPDQVDMVAQVVSDLASEGPPEPLRSGLSPETVDRAVRNGWPPVLFTELIGSIPELERAAQPSEESRADL